MKREERDIVERLVFGVRADLEELKKKHGPYALFMAMQSMLRTRGRRTEHSPRTKYAVWFMVEFYKKLLGISPRMACRYLAKNKVICDLSEGVGPAIGNPNRPWLKHLHPETWRRIYSNEQKRILSIPGEMAKQQWLVDKAVEGQRRGEEYERAERERAEQEIVAQ